MTQKLTIKSTAISNLIIIKRMTISIEHDKNSFDFNFPSWIQERQEIVYSSYLALTIIYLISCVKYYSYALTYNLVISISKSTYQAWAQTCLKEITGTYVISRVIISWILDIHTIDSEFNIFARRCYDSPMALFERLISRRSLSSEWSRSNRSHINRLTATVSWTCCK